MYFWMPYIVCIEWDTSGFAYVDVVNLLVLKIDGEVGVAGIIECFSEIVQALFKEVDRQFFFLVLVLRHLL